MNLSAHLVCNVVVLRTKTTKGFQLALCHHTGWTFLKAFFTLLPAPFVATKDDLTVS